MEPGGLKSILPKEAFPSVKNKEVTKTDQGEGGIQAPRTAWASLSAARKGAPWAAGIEDEGEGRWADHKRCQIHTELAGLNPVDHCFPKYALSKASSRGNEGSLNKLHGLLSCSHPRAFGATVHGKWLSVQCFPASLTQEPFLSGAFHKPPVHLGKQLLKLIGRIPPARAKLNRKLCFRRGGWAVTGVQTEEAHKQGLLSPTQDRVWAWGAHRGDLSQGAAVVQQTSLWPGLASTPLRTTQLACDLPGTMRPAKRALDSLLCWQTPHPQKLITWHLILNPLIFFINQARPLSPLTHDTCKEEFLGPESKGGALDYELPRGPPSWWQLWKQSLWLPQTTRVVPGLGRKQRRTPWSITGQRKRCPPQASLRNIRPQ